MAVAITRMENGKPTWVKGNLSFPHQDRRFTQTGCANCLKPIEADVSWTITCPVRKSESKVRIMRRLSNSLRIQGNSSSIYIPRLPSINSSLFLMFLSKLRNVYSVMKVLIHDGLSRHSDVDVKVADAVTSSITEITRIAAPDAPYNDEQMRDAFG
ncbi:unnamed protein product [Lactuca saligna]|uniref:Uncharacterized protein n=1 Tax=Lactuca saligna TaxID=75948 RepID=A0AA35VFA5_LACSI|nr:unnamed protein product [Lactuca saligna]